MRPGWHQVCTCEAVDMDAFCEVCMAFRSGVSPSVEAQAEVRARVKASMERNRPVLDKLAEEKPFKGGTLGH